MLDLITINPLPEAKLDPAGPFAGELDIQYSDVLVDGVRVRIGETMDFSRADPWSKLAIRAVKTLHDEGEFKGDITILEAGVGDGRNLLQAIGIGPHGGGVDADWKGRVVGIDIDPRRVALARANFEALGLAARADFLEGDAVHRMQEHAARVRSGEAPRLGGAAVACLPQAPLDAETHSSADGFDPRLPSFDRVRDIRLCGRPVADYGLTLNAAFLSELRDCADDNNFRSAPPRASAPAAWAVTTLRASARPVALRANRRAPHSRASSRPRPARGRHIVVVSDPVPRVPWFAALTRLIPPPPHSPGSSSWCRTACRGRRCGSSWSARAGRRSARLSRRRRSARRGPAAAPPRRTPPLLHCTPTRLARIHPPFCSLGSDSSSSAQSGAPHSIRVTAQDPDTSVQYVVDGKLDDGDHARCAERV